MGILKQWIDFPNLGKIWIVYIMTALFLDSHDQESPSQLLLRKIGDYQGTKVSSRPTLNAVDFFQNLFRRIRSAIYCFIYFTCPLLCLMHKDTEESGFIFESIGAPTF